MSAALGTLPELRQGTVPLPQTSGGDGQVKSFSRRILLFCAPELCQQTARPFASANKMREAERRQAQRTNDRATPAVALSRARQRATAGSLAQTACFGRARLSALYRGARRASRPLAQPRTGLPGLTGFNGRPSPAPVQRAPRRPIACTGRSVPGSRPGAGCKNPRPRGPLPLRIQVCLENTSPHERDCSPS